MIGRIAEQPKDCSIVDDPNVEVSPSVMMT
jgi:hypothetical protein